ncbi:MAG: hypothetical protein H6753_06610 [Candidatus Omnitrophica bacterium]|nr:hypothetical protein [Candidatus Omnitrophota bacterium]
MNIPKIVLFICVLCLFGLGWEKVYAQSSSLDDFVMPVVVDEKVPQTYIEKMLMRLEEFEKDLRLKEKYLIVEDHLAQLGQRYVDFQKMVGIEIHGSLQNQTALQIYQPNRANKIANQFYLSGAGVVSPSIKYFVSGRFKYDSVYANSDHYSDSVESDQKAELELRDTYVDYSTGDWDFRLGKQQVVWGEAVGLFYADVVNARDLREYILPDFEFIRIPEWGLSSEYTKNDFHSQLVVLPGVEFDKTGLATSNFAFPLPLPDSPTLLALQDPKEPKYGFDNSKIGARFSYLFNGLDLGAFYLRSWTSLPVMYRTINAGVYNFNPDYQRQNIFGMTFSKEINDYVCKGEAVYYPDAYFSVIDPTDLDGVKQSGYVDYLLGVDHTYFDRWDVNVQLTQRWIMDYDKTFWRQEELTNGFSIRLSRPWLNRKFTTEILAIANLSTPDFLYRPKVVYNAASNLQITLGADIFSGDSTGSFGYFRNQSRWYSEATYKF